MLANVGRSAQAVPPRNIVGYTGGAVAEIDQSVCPAGTLIALGLGSGGTWTLTCTAANHWDLDPGAPSRPAASVHASDEAGWRWLTGATVPREGLRTDGPDSLVQPLLNVRGIIV